MKKSIALICLIAVLLLTGCAAKPDAPSGAQSAAFDETTRTLMPALDAASVASCAYHRNHETAETYEITDRDAIRSLCEALASVRVGEPTDEVAADYDDIPLVGKTVFEQQRLVYRALLEWLDTFEGQFRESG